MISTNQIDIILGVDQCGAVDNNGLPKALPSSILYYTNKWQLYPEELNLKAFTREAIQELFLEKIGSSMDEQNIVIAVDCVFGLPRSTGLNFTGLKNWIADAGSMDGYGFYAAKKFFDSKIGAHEIFRQAEKQLNSGSVFSPYPLQKNIQTGTFRIWKDLNSWSDNSYSMWPFEAYKGAGKPWIIEAYPSLAYLLLQNTKRQFKINLPLDIQSSIANLDALHGFSKDHRDASMAAILTWKIANQGLREQRQVDIEGAILGYQERRSPSQDKNKIGSSF